MVSVDTWEEFYDYVELYIHGTGTHAYTGGFLSYAELAVAPMEKWWRSDEIIPSHQIYGNYLTRKKWNMNEVKERLMDCKIYIKIHFFLFRSLGPFF